MTFNAFREHAESLVEVELNTVGGRSKFSVVVSENAFVYTPISTKKPRSQPLKDVERIFNLYKERGSLSPTDYTQDTMNSSYVLALISNFFSGDGEEGVASDMELGRYEEGRVAERKYLSRSRNQVLVVKRKKLDRNTCQACEYKMVLRGRAIIDCHHKFPLEQGKRETTLEDLVSLCPNCHRIAHVRNPPYSVLEIKQLLGGK